MARFIKFKDLLPFGKKAKNPGYGISRSFYLTVLASDSVLPSLLVLLNPKGEGGAVKGFGVPMQKDAAKADLAKPLSRGFYGLASSDQKTLLKLAVVSKEEAGFDPGPLLKSPAALLMKEDIRFGIAGAWHLLQFTFESYDPEVYPALDFLHSLVKRTAETSNGIIADPLGQVYWVHQEFPIEHDPSLAFATPALVSTKERAESAGLNLYTLGLQKFALPELEIKGVSPSESEIGQAFLLSLCQGILGGSKVELGQRVGHGDASFLVIQGGSNRAHWEGIPCFELVPNSNLTTSAILKLWKESQR